MDQTEDKIGASQGFADRKLNVDGFLDYLSQDERFALAETIYVPCGTADKLLYGDVKARFPAMTKLIHRTWLLVNGILNMLFRVRADIHVIG